MTVKRGPAGTHSWAIAKVRELDSGELYPVEWFCRDCDTRKTTNIHHRATYTFPDGHADQLPEGQLPDPGRSGPCPGNDPAKRLERLAAKPELLRLGHHPTDTTP